jgi:hypothetical protein
VICHVIDSERVPSWKRLVFVVAVALLAMLGAASGAAAAAPTDAGAVNGVPPGDAAAQPPVFSPDPPPVRPEDPPPDGGLPGWLWVVLALLVSAGVSVAVSLWRGSRPPAGFEPILESTAELAAMGNRQSPGIHHGHNR